MNSTWKEVVEISLIFFFFWSLNYTFRCFYEDMMFYVIVLLSAVVTSTGTMCPRDHFIQGTKFCEAKAFFFLLFHPVVITGR